ncbi:hypothetical protein [Streptomyces sp. NPDC051219]|uniref:hypothetical protein n=1 Tax=Streptomyces sp. NPDC051219 TaxID=3155283 RepID=UPI003431AE80
MAVRGSRDVLRLPVRPRDKQLGWADADRTSVSRADRTPLSPGAQVLVEAFVLLGGAVLHAGGQGGVTDLTIS